MTRTPPTDELRLSLPLLEEAAAALQALPPRAWACHLAGTAPFVYALVSFWSDLCNRPVAQAQPLAWALPVAAAHLWMRVWQSRFCAYLADQRRGDPPQGWSIAEWARCAVNQLRFGAPAFVALLPAFFALIPYGWAYAFYQNLAITSHRPGGGRLAWEAARQTPYQNHALIAWLTLCWLAAFCNVFSVVLVAPGFIKLFMPVEWAFTRYPLWFLNSTALCVVAAITYLLTDPLVKSVYVLRAFYGLSQRTGADIQTDWRRLARPAAKARILAVMALALSWAAPAVASPAREGLASQVPHASPAAPFESTLGPSPANRLDAAIEQALHDPRYDWRIPADLSDAGDSWLSRQVKRMFEAIERFIRLVGRFLRTIFDWLSEHLHLRKTDPGASPEISSGALSTTLALLLLGSTVLLASLLWRSRKRAAVAEATPLAAIHAPDVSDESVTADILPDEEWLRLAEQFRAAREYRKSARAYYLALLACLDRRGLITLQRAKTNADYLRELRRRTVGHLFDESPFRQASRLFEAGWYGDHPVTSETLESLRVNVEVYRHE